MRHRWVTAVIAVLVVVSVGGVGFAAFTSTVTLQLNGAAGTLTIEWTGPATPTVTGSSPTDKCTATLTPSLLTINAGNLAPGDSCMLLASNGVEITDTGSLPGTLQDISVSFNPVPSTCTWFDNNPTFPATVAGGGGIWPVGGFFFQIGLTAGQPTCGGATLSWTLQVVATAGT